ncbi:hypothetical protein [Streptococcus constellatus]|uniref:hypothetical protein n=1 Tax=Streptococcus constellatus TaxID=76860 RepID=UPI00065FA980|nr:hypothetical protein [Streptococcus constellatus]UTX64035.1 hypothetical protein DEH83_01230 [Streptococcus constellatus]
MAFVVDGTFLCFDNTYDVKHFEKIYQMLQDKDIKVVVISDNQYAQLASFFSKRSAPQEIVAFGDGGNDLEKLAYVEQAMR